MSKKNGNGKRSSGSTEAFESAQSSITGVLSTGSVRSSNTVKASSAATFYSTRENKADTTVPVHKHGAKSDTVKPVGKANKYHSLKKAKSVGNIPKDTEELDPKILPEHIKNKFLDVQLHVCTYLNLSYQDQIEIFWRLQNGVSTKLSEKFVALFSSEEDCNTFNKLCEKQYEHIKKFAKDIHRKDHCLLIAELLFITKFDRIETSWTSKNITKNLLNIFKESDLEKTKIFRRLELAIKYLFSPKLLNHDAISHRINKNKLYVIIYKINKKYSSKWDNLTDDECKKIRQVIIKLKKEPESIKIKYETTNKVLIKIAELYDKYYSMNDDKKYSESSDEHTSDNE